MNAFSAFVCTTRGKPLLLYEQNKKKTNHDCISQCQNKLGPTGGWKKT